MNERSREPAASDGWRGVEESGIVKRGTFAGQKGEEWSEMEKRPEERLPEEFGWTAGPVYPPSPLDFRKCSKDWGWGSGLQLTFPTPKAAFVSCWPARRFPHEACEARTTLPPSLCLHSVSKPAVLSIRYSTHESPETLGPTGIGQKRPQDRPAEELFGFFSWLKKQAKVVGADPREGDLVLLPRPIRELLGELCGERGGVPVLPAFDEEAVLNPDDRGAGDRCGFAGGGVTERGGPMEGDEVAFGQGDDGRDAEVREAGAEIVMEAREGFRTTEFGGAIVDDGVRREEFKDGFAAGLVPDFLEPAEQEMLALFGNGNRVRRGHEEPPQGLLGAYRNGGKLGSREGKKENGELNFGPHKKKTSAGLILGPHVEAALAVKSDAAARVVPDFGEPRNRNGYGIAEEVLYFVFMH